MYQTSANKSTERWDLALKVTIVGLNVYILRCYLTRVSSFFVSKSWLMPYDDESCQTRDVASTLILQLGNYTLQFLFCEHVEIRLGCYSCHLQSNEIVSINSVLAHYLAFAWQQRNFITIKFRMNVKICYNSFFCGVVSRNIYVTYRHIV